MIKEHDGTLIEFTMLVVTMYKTCPSMQARSEISVHVISGIGAGIGAEVCYLCWNRCRSLDYYVLKQVL